MAIAGGSTDNTLVAVNGVATFRGTNSTTEYEAITKQGTVQTTTNATTVIAQIPVGANQAIHVRGNVMGMRSTANEMVGGDLIAISLRAAANTNVSVPNVTVRVIENSSGSPTFTVSANTTTQTADITVTGEANKTFDWLVTYEYYKIQV